MGETRISKVTTVDEAAKALGQLRFRDSFQWEIRHSYISELSYLSGNDRNAMPIPAEEACMFANELSGFNSQTEADLAALLEAAESALKEQGIFCPDCAEFTTKHKPGCSIDELAAVVERVKENKK